eukprot:Pgem_evm1s10003
MKNRIQTNSLHPKSFASVTTQAATESPVLTPTGFSASSTSSNYSTSSNSNSKSNSSKSDSESKSSHSSSSSSKKGSRTIFMAVGAGLSTVLALTQANPFAAQVIIATVKTSIADIIVQKKVEKSETIDWKRNALFICFGFSYLGLIQWVIYVRGFQRLFPAMNKFCSQSMREKLKNREGLKALAGQIGLDF